MEWTGMVVAGLVATAVMTALMYSGPMMGMPKMDMAQMLGSMVLPMGGAAFTAGMMMHIVNGIIFVIIYALIWNWLSISVTWWSGLAFGVVHFAVAAMGMAMMSSMHKEIKAGNLPSPTAAGARGMMGVLIAHLVFGLVVGLIYGAYV